MMSESEPHNTPAFQAGMVCSRSRTGTAWANKSHEKGGQRGPQKQNGSSGGLR